MFHIMPWDVDRLTSTELDKFQAELTAMRALNDSAD